MDKIAIHVSDAPIVLYSGDSLFNKHIVCGGSVYGRVLFTEPICAIETLGPNIDIKNCLIESLQ